MIVLWIVLGVVAFGVWYVVNLRACRRDYQLSGIRINQGDVRFFRWWSLLAAVLVFPGVFVLLQKRHWFRSCPDDDPPHGLTYQLMGGTR